MIDRCFRLMALLALLVVVVPHTRAADADTHPLPSSRLSALARDAQTGNRDAVGAFWTEMAGKTPLVEPVPGDARHRHVTFLWRGDDKTTSVLLVGGLSNANISKPLTHLADTDVWYLTETHSSAARFDYFFLVNEPTTPPANMTEFMQAMQLGQPRPDPPNPRSFEGRPYIELPDAPPQPWIQERPSVLSGTITHRTFKSTVLKAEYPLTVYTPPGYGKARTRCWLLIAFDGGFPMMETTLDNLFAAGKIPPVVVVSVDNLSQDSRNRDLGGSQSFAAFLTGELAPWARKTYRVDPSAKHTIVGGQSLGGFMAAYCGLNASKTFGNVIALSPTLIIAPGQVQPNDVWDDEAPGVLPRQYATAARRPVRFYVAVGRYENFYLASLLNQARRWRDVLTAKGYDVTYHEFIGGHNSVCWRGEFADAMVALTKPAGTTPKSRERHR